MLHPTDVVVDAEYLRKLERMAEILNDVKNALPSGLEGFIEQEEYEELFY